MPRVRGPTQGLIALIPGPFDPSFFPVREMARTGLVRFRGQLIVVDAATAGFSKPEVCSLRRFGGFDFKAT